MSKAFPPDIRIAAPPYDISARRGHNTLGRRLREARRSCRMTQMDVVRALSACGSEIGIAALSKWENGQAVPNAHQFLALCAILGRTEDAFSYFAAAPAPLNAQGMKKLRDYMDDLLASGRYAPDAQQEALPCAVMTEVRVYDEPAAAGPGCFLDSGAYETLSFPASSIPEGTDFGVRVCGVSMEPNYVSGQIVWVEQCTQLSDGEIGIFIYDGNAYLKRYQPGTPDEDEREAYTDSEGFVYPKVTLASINPACADVQVRPDSEFRIIGRVLN